MPARPRRELVDDSEVGYYHCVARCVRRAFLCGNDAYSGQNFDHRKTWTRDRLETLAAIFGIEVIGFTVMSFLRGLAADSGAAGDQWVKLVEVCR